jgi:hypothetical protein
MKVEKVVGHIRSGLVLVAAGAGCLSLVRNFHRRAERESE